MAQLMHIDIFLIQYNLLKEHIFSNIGLNYFMKDKSPQKTRGKLEKHYGESAPSIRMVYKSFQNYLYDLMGTSNAVAATSPQNHS